MNIPDILNNLLVSAEHHPVITGLIVSFFAVIGWFIQLKDKSSNQGEVFKAGRDISTKRGDITSGDKVAGDQVAGDKVIISLKNVRHASAPSIKVEIQQIKPYYNKSYFEQSNWGTIALPDINPDGYVVNIRFSNMDINPNTIKDVELLIDGKHLKPIDFSPIKIDGRSIISKTFHYSEDKNKIKQNGSFSIVVTDVFDKSQEASGNFPLG